MKEPFEIMRLNYYNWLAQDERFKGARSSVAERPAHNRLVVGSNPAEPTPIVGFGIFVANLGRQYAAT